MSMEAKKPYVVRHITFTPEEDAIIQELAREAGMSVCGYIRKQAVYGTVRSVDWKLLEQHTEAINYIGEEIKVYTSDKNPNPWLFAADLSLITQRLDEIKELEVQLIQKIGDPT